METSFNKICKSIATLKTESQCIAIEAMIKTFKEKYKQEGHELFLHIGRSFING